MMTDPRLIAISSFFRSLLILIMPQVLAAAVLLGFVDGRFGELFAATWTVGLLVLLTLSTVVLAVLRGTQTLSTISGEFRELVVEHRRRLSTLMSRTFSRTGLLFAILATATGALASMLGRTIADPHLDWIRNLAILLSSGLLTFSALSFTMYLAAKKLSHERNRIGTCAPGQTIPAMFLRVPGVRQAKPGEGGWDDVSQR